MPTLSWQTMILVCIFVIVTAHTATSSPTEATSCQSTSIDDKVKPTATQKQKKICKLYLAESSIPNAGLGMYSGVPISPNQTLTISQQDVVIPILDIELHNDYNPIEWLIRDYTWSSSMLGGVHLEAKRVTSLVPGFGALPNSHSALTNIAFLASAITTTNRECDRQSDVNGGGALLLHRTMNYPGVGSISPYHSYHYATRTIEAGSELFHDYGERWVEKRRSTLGPIAQKKHYQSADTIISCVNEFRESGSLDDKAAEVVWEELRRIGNETSTSPSVIVSRLGDNTEINNKQRILDGLKKLLSNISCIVQDVQTEVALNFSYDVLPDATKVGSARASLPNFIRSLSWLEQHGRCIDGLEVHLSSIPGANQGAFATRQFLEGDIITTTPLLPINRSMLDTYQFSMNHPGKQRKLSSQKLGRQLLLNYCYGHPDSPSLVFFPYGPVVNRINHGDENRVNARIDWSTFSWQQQSEWLIDISAEDLLKQPKSGLLLDIVATKPIFSGEEVLLDYGKEWKKEWRRHVDSRTPPDAANHECHGALNVVEPYTSDIHLPGAFRYPIGIPDDIFPENWKG